MKKRWSILLIAALILLLTACGVSPDAATDSKTTHVIGVAVYSATDMMNVIRSYNEDATYEAFTELAGNSDIESVRARLGK
ncbi:MAG: hypothetical protein LIO80_02140 [Lachnospiraceae bacterium]|nr:hypothetical protein [Lachnospiraceae bacterium]